MVISSVFLFLELCVLFSHGFNVEDDFNSINNTSELQLIKKHANKFLRTDYPDLVLDLPPQEISALFDFYWSTNGDNWTKPKYNQSGIVWNFNESSQSNPCFDNWLGISCICNVNASDFHWFSSYGDYYYFPNASPDEELSSDHITCHVNKIYLIDYNLVGTLPESFRNLTHLTHLHLSMNTIYGSFPTVLYGLQNLTLIDFGANQLSELPNDIYLLQSVEYLNFWDNPIKGTLPASLGLLTGLRSFAIGNCPDLYGTVPELFSNLVNLAFLMFSHTSLSGTFPSNIYTTLTDLRSLFLDNSYFSGPHNLDILFENSLGGLEEIKLNNNLLSGTVPSNFYGHANNMIRLWLNSNRLVGSIPSEITNLPNLQVFDISHNHITHTLPDAFTNMSSIVWFICTDTLLTGSLPPEIGHMSTLKRLALSNNILTGIIPQSVSELRQIEQLLLHDNHLSGLIPVDQIISLSHLEDILLQNNRFSGELKLSLDFNSTSLHNISLVNVDVSGNRITATIPERLFGVAHSLQTFAAGKNCIHGALSTDICLSESLQQLILDGVNTGEDCLSSTDSDRTTGQEWADHIDRYTNSDVGTIPDCLFAMPTLRTLHLSGNGFKGTLPDLATLSPVLQDLSLSHNQISGSIPSVFQIRSWLNLDLSYNKLTDTLSEHFAPLRQNSSLSLIVNRLSGNLPSAFKNAPNIAVLRGSLFGCELSGRELPSNDQDKSNFSCGSNSLNVLLYVWLGMFAFVALCVRLKPIFYAMTNVNVKVISDNMTWNLLRKIKRMFVRITVFNVGVLLPVYCIFTVYFKNYTFSYAWITSAVFLSGLIPAVVCGILWFSFLLLLFYRCETVLFRDEFQTQMINKQIIKNNHLIVDNTFSRLLIMAFFAVVNIIAVVLVNIAYVYVDINYSATVNGLAQVGLAFFKLLWNSVLVPRSLSLLFRKPVIGADVSRAHAKIMQDQVEMNAIVFETILNLFNNIVAPCVAVFVANVNCFYNLIVAPPSVHSSYSIEECVSVTEHFKCFDSTISAYGTSFAPPFAYSYQCGSTLVTSYVSVFVYMYILDSFVNPILLYVILRILRACTGLYNYIYGIEVEYIPPRKNFVFFKNRFVIKFVTNFAVLMTFGVMFPLLAVVACVSVVSEIAEIQSHISEYFDDENQLVVKREVKRNNTTRAMSAGTPEVKNTAASDVLQDMGESDAEAQVQMSDLNHPEDVQKEDVSPEPVPSTMPKSRLSYNQRNAEYKLYQVEQKFNKVSYILSHLLWMLFPLSAVFYAAFLFDMMGDARGFEDAVRVSVLMLGVPCVMMCLYELYRRRQIMNEIKRIEEEVYMQEDETARVASFVMDNPNRGKDLNSNDSDKHGAHLSLRVDVSEPKTVKFQTPDSPITPRISPVRRHEHPTYEVLLREDVSSRSNNSYSNQQGCDDGVEEGQGEDEKRTRRKSHRVEKVEETAGDFIQQALSLLLK